MRRALGVLVVMTAMVASAAADKASKPAQTDAQTPAKADAKKADKADPKKPTKADAKKPAGADAKDATDEAVDAEGSDEDAPPTREEIEASLPPHVTGPKHVDLGNGVAIDLPADTVLFEHAEAKKILEEVGDYGDNVIALIRNFDSNWEISVDYDDVGYVSDKDANELDAKDLFSTFVEGNKEQNVRRKSLNMPELYLDGWSEMPTYQAAAHHLVWGLKVHSSEGPAINSFTRVLGRNGYLSVNLVDSPESIEQSKKDTAALVAAIQFQSGSRYEDHKDYDKDSGMGLKALVLGGAGVAVVKAAKAGILVKLLLVFKKAFLVIFAAIGGFFKWLFGRKKQEPSNDVSSSDPPSSPEA
jgi:uncharacterized membrane-anchored protein